MKQLIAAALACTMLALPRLAAAQTAPAILRLLLRQTNSRCRAAIPNCQANQDAVDVLRTPFRPSMAY
jgi:hypothetical protein